MPTLSISQLAAFTGKDRRTVTKAVERLDFTEGPDRAHLYDSALAFAAIYMPPPSEAGEGAPVTLDQARRDLALAQAAHVRTKHESERRQRIPLPIVTDVWDAALQTFAATLKAAKGKPLTPAKINELLEQLRAVKLPLAW